MSNRPFLKIFLAACLCAVFLLAFAACKEKQVFADSDDFESYPEYWNDFNDNNGDIYIPNSNNSQTNSTDDTNSDDPNANFDDDDESDIEFTEPDNDADGTPDVTDPDDDNDGIPDDDDDDSNGNDIPDDEETSSETTEHQGPLWTP